MKGRLLANVSNKETVGVFALISNTLSISEIFQILLIIKIIKIPPSLYF